MPAKYDTERDILRIRWSEAPIEESDEKQPGVIFDYDRSGNASGVEILNASHQTSQRQQLNSSIGDRAIDRVNQCRLLRILANFQQLLLQARSLSRVRKLTE